MIKKLCIFVLFGAFCFTANAQYKGDSYMGVNLGGRFANDADCGSFSFTAGYLFLEKTAIEGSAFVIPLFASENLSGVWWGIAPALKQDFFKRETFFFSFKALVPIYFTSLEAKKETVEIKHLQKVSFGVGLALEANILFTEKLSLVASLQEEYMFNAFDKFYHGVSLGIRYYF